MRKEINERITRCRKMAGLSQTEMAKLLGMRATTYSQKERTGIISADLITKFAEIFHISPEMLLTGSNEELMQIAAINKEVQTVPVSNEPVLKDEAKAENSSQDRFYEEFVLKPREKNLIIMLRNMSKAKRDRISQLIYDEFKSKG